MERQSTEEENEHWTPFDGFPETDKERLLTQSVPQHGVGEGREDVEDDSHTDEDLPGCDVELIDGGGEPPDDQVVGQCEWDGGGDGVVCADICDDRNLAGNFDVAEEEFAEERCDWSSSPPVFEGVEDELVAAVSVFLPAGEFVVDGEGDTFFETAVVVGCQSALQLARSGLGHEMSTALTE